jgi:hypothetical protein
VRVFGKPGVYGFDEGVDGHCKRIGIHEQPAETVQDTRDVEHEERSRLRRAAAKRTGDEAGR